MNKIFKWLRESNRYVHIIGGIAIGLGADGWYCSMYAGLGIASALELKDRMWGGKWDWIDWSLTVAGSIVGRLICMAL